MNIEILGYHGTTQNSALNIIENNNFKKSTKKNEWLGHGVYFYELYEKAEWWGSRNEKPAIIKSNILVPEKYYINLDKPSEEDKLAEFIKFVERSGKKFIVSGDKIEKRCKLMNLYMKYGDFKVISATFPSTNKNYKNHLDSIGYVRTEKQICVHDTECIVYNELEVMS
ncbi:hypothetical protein [Staphylococcus nepalensis]|uniref:DUF3990 domain-containing protein n=1 Tax=Staphylococcus nepalensis TaxID=214473 RepID=A0A380GQ84_9STAP|nr:hypothetical protein [Staphylococcus nepalensis]GGB85311.1 hypothetical protein GCM10007203_15650 [Staphylococcus nepalensis]SUM55388.1 Uncharacterised protein [Staphylococcus nepalensis]VDG67361.1 Uncharacterised protein [Lacrimispora indolis]